MSKVRYRTDAKKEWDERTSLTRATKYTLPFFDEVVRPHLGNLIGKKSCIELGAIPGGYLAYFAKEFGYRPSGIDFAVNTDVFDRTMQLNSIEDYDFFSQDVMNFTSEKRYDLVCSFGFIEHFNDIEGVLKKHNVLLARRGFMLVTVPNFRHIQWVYHRLFDRHNLAIHNTRAMRMGYVSKVLEGMGLERVFVSAVGHAEFWFDDQLPPGFYSKLRTRVTNAMNKRLHFIRANRAFSPYLVYLYRKP